MKTIIRLIGLGAIFISCQKNEVRVNEYVTIRDKSFETALVDKSIDSEGLVDGRILRNDVLAATHLDLSDLRNLAFGENEDGYINLEDILLFENITFLQIRGSTTTGFIDLSQNLKLDTLKINYSKISKLDLGNNTNLKALYLNSVFTDSLNLEANKQLAYIEIYSSPLTSLILGQGLEKLICEDTHLKRMNVSKSERLSYLVCVRSYLEELDLSKNLILDYVHLTNNYLHDLKLPRELCQDAGISELHIEKNTNSLRKVCVCDAYQANANLMKKLNIPYHYWTYAWTTDDSVIFEECEK